jgi:hypothetical protein
LKRNIKPGQIEILLLPADFYEAGSNALDFDFDTLAVPMLKLLAGGEISHANYEVERLLKLEDSKAGMLQNLLEGLGTLNARLAI